MWEAAPSTATAFRVIAPGMPDRGYPSADKLTPLLTGGGALTTEPAAALTDFRTAYHPPASA
jgi:hypothetical protein